MKALTLWQPWATLVAMEEKCIETRSWSTKYRGEIAIHAAAKRPPKWLGASAHTDGFRDELADVFCVRRDRDDRAGKHVDDILHGLPYGKMLCIVRLLEICETSCMQRDELPMREQIFGNYEDGRYAWNLEMVEVFESPIPVKGNRMLWNWNPPVIHSSRQVVVNRQF
jgi:activating signal cointegrator 1